MKIGLEINCDNAMLERKMVKLVCKIFARGRFLWIFRFQISCPSSEISKLAEFHVCDTAFRYEFYSRDSKVERRLLYWNKNQRLQKRLNLKQVKNLLYYF